MHSEQHGQRVTAATNCSHADSHHVKCTDSIASTRFCHDRSASCRRCQRACPMSACQHCDADSPTCAASKAVFASAPRLPPSATPPAPLSPGDLQPARRRHEPTLRLPRLLVKIPGCACMSSGLTSSLAGWALAYCSCTGTSLPVPGTSASSTPSVGMRISTLPRSAPGGGGCRPPGGAGYRPDISSGCTAGVVASRVHSDLGTRSCMSCIQASIWWFSGPCASIYINFVESIVKESSIQVSYCLLISQRQKPRRFSERDSRRFSERDSNARNQDEQRVQHKKKRLNCLVAVSAPPPWPISERAREPRSVSTPTIFPPRGARLLQALQQLRALCPLACAD